jgi:hypothetical protein
MEIGFWRFEGIIRLPNNLLIQVNRGVGDRQFSF